MGGRHLPARRRAPDGVDDHAEVRRPPPARRGRRRHARHRPRAAAARRARHGQDLGLRAPRGGDQRRLARCSSRARPARPRRRSATAGTTPGCSPRARAATRSCPSPVIRAMARRQDRPRRGAHPHPVRRAGRADHDPVREDAADPGARRRGPGRPGLQPHRHRQRPRPRRQRAVQRAAPPLQHRRAAAAGHRRGGGRHRPRCVDAARRARSSCPPAPSALEEIRRVVTIFRELRDGRHRGRPHEAQVADAARCPPPRRSPSSPTASRSPPTSATASLRARGRRRRAHRRGRPGPGRRTRSSGRSTWRRSCASATAGATSTAPAGRCDATPVFGIRHHGPARPAALERALDAAAARRGPDRGPARGRRAAARWPRDEEMAPPVALLAYVPDEPGARRVLPVRALLARVAGDPLRARARRAGALHRPARREQAGRRGERRAAARAARRPARRRWPRPPATATPSAGGRTSSSPRARARRVRGRRRGDGRRCARRSRSDDPREERREAYMRQSIRAAAKAGAENVAVVCGAWHAPALAEPGPAAPDQRTLKGLPEGQGRRRPGCRGPTACSRASQRLRRGRRLARLVRPALRRGRRPGRRAGWRAPRGCCAPRAWTRPPRRSSTRRGSRGARRHPRPAARRARRAARRHPRRALRRLRRAARARARASSSSATGSARCPTTTPMVPLQQDLARLQRRLRLKPEAQVEGAHARPAPRERPRAQPAAAPAEPARGAVGRRRSRRAALGTFKEAFRLEWQPELALDLIHAGRWGTTVEAAAAAKARARGGASRRASPRWPTLADAVLLADLPDALEAVLRALADRAALDRDTADLMAAVPPLAGHPALRRRARQRHQRGRRRAARDRAAQRGRPARAPASAPTRRPARSSPSSSTASTARSRCCEDADAHARVARGAAARRRRRPAPGHARRPRHPAPARRGRARPRAAPPMSRALSPGEDARARRELDRGLHRHLRPRARPRPRPARDPRRAGSRPSRPDAFTNVLPLLRRAFSVLPAGERRRLGERLREPEGATGARRGRSRRSTLERARAGAGRRVREAARGSERRAAQALAARARRRRRRRHGRAARARGPRDRRRARRRLRRRGSGGLGASAPTVARWLGELRAHFPAGRRAGGAAGRDRPARPAPAAARARGAGHVTPDVHLAATLMSLRDALPEASRHGRAAARAAGGARTSSAGSPTARAAPRAARWTAARGRARPRPAEIDWDRTIRANLSTTSPSTGRSSRSGSSATRGGGARSRPS